MAKVRLYGETSGYVDLKAPDVAGDVTITLPNATGAFATEPYVDAAVAGVPVLAGIGSNVVSTAKLDTFTTTSASPVDITGLSATITPTSITSKILVIVQIMISNTLNNSASHSILVRDSTAIAIGNAAGVRPRVSTSFDSQNNTKASSGPSSVVFLDSPATISAVTYKMQTRIGAAGTVLINGNGLDADDAESGRTASTITLIEVAA